jgi:progesterone-induced-blocking factor 1
MSQTHDMEGSNIYLQTLQSAPTSSKRRIQQALALAQRLTIKQKECEELLKKVSQLDRERDNIQQELNLSKSLINKSQQPYGYLIQTIEEKEHEIRELKDRIKINNEEFHALKSEHGQLIQVSFFNFFYHEGL